eukprot:SAG11_NODE_1542_length_4717_cov_2.974881_5_plen_241_part_01
MRSENLPAYRTGRTRIYTWIYPDLYNNNFIYIIYTAGTHACTRLQAPRRRAAAVAMLLLLLLLLLQLVMAAAMAAMAGNSACHIDLGVEYLKPAHYKEFKDPENATAAACCARCSADGVKCGSWKLCRYSDGLSCRLLPSAPTRKIKAGARCQASGLSPDDPAPPSPPTPPPTTGFCDPREFGATGDGVTVDTAAINAAVVHCGGLTFRSGLVFLTGTIKLKSNLVIVIENNATILGAKGH